MLLKWCQGGSFRIESFEGDLWYEMGHKFLQPSRLRAILVLMALNLKDNFRKTERGGRSLANTESQTNLFCPPDHFSLGFRLYRGSLWGIGLFGLCHDLSTLLCLCDNGADYDAIFQREETSASRFTPVSVCGARGLFAVCVSHDIRSQDRDGVRC